MNQSSSLTSAGSAIHIEEARALVNAYMTRYFDTKVTKARLTHPSYAKLWKAIDELSQAGGKRFRPYMTLLSYQAAGGLRPLEDILPAAVAQEVLHLGMLVHDDIIDRDYVRYGVDNVSGTYKQMYASLFDDPLEVQHFSDGAAILAGDLLISAAYELISELSLSDIRAVDATRTLSEAIFSVVGGELLDTESAFVSEPADAEVIATYKTASYSFVGPLVMGAQLANASAEHISLLTDFGTKLGVAFQLQDDLLGVFGDEDVTGKSATGDLREGKKTYLIEQFYRLADQPQRDKFNASFGSPTASSADITTLRRLLVESGAKDATTSHIATLAETAAATLSQMQLDERHARALQELITLSTKRAR